MFLRQTIVNILSVFLFITKMMRKLMR